jgi:hypothetical protein
MTRLKTSSTGEDELDASDFVSRLRRHLMDNNNNKNPTDALVAQEEAIVMSLLGQDVPSFGESTETLPPPVACALALALVYLIYSLFPWINFIAISINCVTIPSDNLLLCAWETVGFIPNYIRCIKEFDDDADDDA